MAKKTSKASSKLSKSKGVIKRKNPFELLSNGKTRQKILNKRQPNKKKNLVVSRTQALQKRYTEILKDYKDVSKANSFNDNRFGENSDLTFDERNLARLRKTRNKRDRYNIDSNPVQKFHNALGTKSFKSSDDQLEEDQTFDPAGLVEKLYKENGEDDPELRNVMNTEARSNRRASREQILKDVMMKAKLYKAERQKEKSELEESRELNDEAFNSIFKANSGLQFKPSKGARLDDLTEKQKIFVATEEKEQKEVSKEKYNLLVKQLKETVKVKATDKTLTIDEKAQKEKRKLEELQKEFDDRRLEELQDDFSEKPSKKKMKSSLFDEYGNSINVSLFNKENNSEETETVFTKQAPRHSRKKTLSAKTLPFLLPIDVDFTLVDLTRLIRNYNDEESIVKKVCERIRKTNSVHLEASNRQKMINFLNILVEYLMFVTSLKKDSKLRTELKTDVGEVLEQIYRAAEEVQSNLSDIFLPKIKQVKNQLKQQLEVARKSKKFGGDFGSNMTEIGMPHQFQRKRKRGGHKGKKGQKKIMEEDSQFDEEMIELYGTAEEQVSLAQCWPSVSTLAFMRLLFQLFPVTNFRHPITGSALLLIEKYLSSCPIRGHKDILAALALTKLLTDVKNISQASTVAVDNIFFSGIWLTLEALFSQIVATKHVTREQRFLRLGDIANAGSKGFLVVEKFSKAKKSNETSFLNKLRDFSICTISSNFLTDTLTNILEKGIENSSGHLDLATVQVKVYVNLLKANKVKSLSALKTLSGIKTPLVLVDIKDTGIKIEKPAFSVEHFGKEKQTTKVVTKNLQKQVKKEKRNLLKDIRRDTALLAAKKREEENKRSGRQKRKLASNMRFIEEMNQNINNAVKSGERLAGGGTRNVDMKGRRRR